MPNRWNDIMALFEAALEQSSEQRMAWLAANCDDPGIRAEVEHLLEAHEHSGGILDAPLYPLSAAASEGSVERRVGPYRTVRLLGHGGMGSVYLAERADGQFDQQVALKLLRTGFASDDHLARFLAERQILASLDHPNIAHLLDGGVSEAGQPYFVMELVEGEPLDRYCDARQLSIRERIRLFLDVCAAVQYAHRSLVVHRDLKPSNVLVTTDGTVKLLDFGIAKLLDAEAVLGRSAPVTRTGLLPMTPSYASPEQVRGETVTTASDVYQLGVVLYELLTGHRPYRLRGRTPSEIERIVCEEEPTRPSTAVTRRHAPTAENDATPEQIGQARETEPERLRKMLRGDLDTIVMKALRKEPERRYASAQELADDLTRYLSDRPVTACEDSIGYRTRKFVRRNRWGVAVTAVIALLVMSSVVALTLQNRRIAQERDRVRVEAMKTAHVRDFLIDLFGQSDPAARGNTPTVGEVLDTGVARIRKDLANHPEIQAEMMKAVGGVYERLGRYDDARPLLEDALAMQRSLFGERHAAVASSLSDLAALEQQEGNYTEAERLFRDALTVQRALRAEDHIEVAERKSDLAALLHTVGRIEEAAALYAEALPVYQRVLGDSHSQTADVLASLGLLRMELGAYAGAEAHLRRALQMRRRTLEDDHPTIAVSKGALGACLTARGRFAEARSLLLQSYEALRERQGIEHENTRRSVEHLVALYEAWAKPDSAAAFEALLATETDRSAP